MSRVFVRVTPPRLAAAVLALIAVLDLAAGLGLLPHDARPTSDVIGRTRRARPVPEPPRGSRALRVVAPRVRVRPGDRVDVLVTLDAERFPSAEPTRTVGDGLTVLAVDQDRADPDAQGVTLAVPRALVPRVAFAATSGTLTLAVVPDHRRR